MLACQILTTEVEVNAIINEWQHLQLSIGRIPHTDPGMYQAWWDHIGKPRGKQPCIVTGRADGKLVGLLPLSRQKRCGLQVVQGIGVESMHYVDTLTASADCDKELWQALRQSGLFDLAIVRAVDVDSACSKYLNGFATQTRFELAPVITNNWNNSAGWMATLSQHHRKNYKGLLRKFAKSGIMNFAVSNSNPLPTHIIDELVDRKIAWSLENNKAGIFHHKGVHAYFRETAAAMVKHNQFYLTTLACSDRVVATCYNFGTNGIFYTKTLGNDPEWAAISPGVIMLTETVKWAIDQGYGVINLGLGMFPYKLRLTKETKEYAEWTFGVTPKGKLAALAYIVLQSFQRLVQRIKGEGPVGE